MCLCATAGAESTLNLLPPSPLISLMSAVGILCLGGGISVYHGVIEIFRPSPIELAYMREGLAVLAMSFFVEGYSLVVAMRAVREGARMSGEHC